MPQVPQGTLRESAGLKVIRNGNYLPGYPSVAAVMAVGGQEIFQPLSALLTVGAIS